MALRIDCKTHTPRPRPVQAQRHYFRCKSTGPRLAFGSAGGASTHSFAASLFARRAVTAALDAVTHWHFWKIPTPPRVRTHYSHQMTVAAMQIAAKKVWAQRSYRVAMRCQSFRRPNMFSTLCLCLYSALSNRCLNFRFFLGGMHGVIPRPIRPSWNQLAS